MTDKNTKKSILWNIVQPGDPYDIKKSMIARLPQHPKIFMGQHLQLVCLMQAAEIQRLSQYLDQYKLRYKEVNRVELDRHSYQIQIKQLSEKIGKYEGLSNENQKLKDFLKRQSAQLQDMQKVFKNYRGSGEQLKQLQLKYEGLLAQLKYSRQRITELERINNSIIIDVNAWRTKFEDSQRSRVYQLQSQRQKLELFFKEKVEVQMRQIMYKFQTQVTELKSQLSLSREQLESKNHEIQSLTYKKDNLIKEIAQLQSQLKNASRIQGEFYNKTNQLSQLSALLQQKTSKLQQISMNCESLDRKYRSLEELNNNIQKQRDFYFKKCQQLQKDLSKGSINKQDYERLENKCAMLSSEIERLQFLRNNKNNECLELQSQISQLNGQIRGMQKNESQNSRVIQNLNQKIRSIEMEARLKNQDSSRARFLEQELHKVNSSLKVKVEQYETLQQKIRILNSDSSSQIKSLKVMIDERDRRINQLNEQISYLNQQLEEPTRTLKVLQQQIEHYQVSLPRLSQQLSRLTNLLSNKERELSNANAQMARIRLNYETLQKETLIIKNQNVPQQRIEIQVKKRIEVFENKVLIVQRENRELKLLTQTYKNEVTNLKRDKMSNEQNYIYQKEQLVIRINNLQSIQGKFLIIQRQNNELRKSQQPIKRRLSDYQREIDKIRRQLNDRQQRLRIFEGQRLQRSKLIDQNRELNDKIRRLEQQLSMVSQIQNQKSNKLSNQIRRLEETIRMKIQQISTLEQRVSISVNSTNQIVHLKSVLHQKEDAYNNLQFQFKEVRRVLNQYEQRQQSLIRRLGQVEGLKRQLSRRDQMVKQYQSNLIKNSNQIERVRIALNNKQEEYNRLNIQFQRLRQGYETIYSELTVVKRQGIIPPQKLQIQVKKRIEIYERKVIEIQHTLRQQREQYSELTKRYRQFEQRIQVLIGQKQEANRQIHEYQLQIRSLESTNNNKIMLYQQKTREEIRNHEQRLQSLLQQLDRLANVVKNRDETIKKLQLNIGQLSQGKGQQLEKRTAELRVIIQKLQSEIRQLHHKIQIANSQLNEKDRIIHQKDRIILQKERILSSESELKQRHQVILQNYNKCQIQLTNTRAMLSELQQMNRHTCAQRDELFRLCHDLQNKLQSINQNQISVQQFNRVKRQLTSVYQENKKLVNLVAELRRNEEQYTLKLREYDEKTKLFERQINVEVERKLYEMNIEREQFLSKIAALQQENEQLNIIAHEYQAKLHGFQDHQESTLQRLKSQIERLNHILHQKVNQLERERQNAVQMSRQRAQQQTRISLLSQQLTMIASKQKGEQLQFLRVQVIQKENEGRMWEQRYTALYSSFKQLQNVHQRTLVEHQRMKAVINDYGIKMQRIQQEFTNLNRLIHSLKQENMALKQGQYSSSQLQQKNLKLSQEIDRLNQIIYQLKKELQDVRLKLTDQFALHRRIQEFMALMVVLFAEIQSLRNRLKQTQNQCQNVRRSSISPFRVDRKSQPRR